MGTGKVKGKLGSTTHIVRNRSPSFNSGKKKTTLEALIRKKKTSRL